MNDTIATAHAESDNADKSLAQRLSSIQSHSHFDLRGSCFLVKHYGNYYFNLAGDVLYSMEGISEKNKDQLAQDLLLLIQSSANCFLKDLFPDVLDADSKRPPTASDKIKVNLFL